jgi:large subunit ribosomal protein L17
MKHRVKGRKLKRTASHKKALMSNLSASLIKHQRIHTTEAKAKELRIYVEPLVTKAKKALKNSSDPAVNVHYRREAKRFLGDDEAVKMLFEKIAPQVGDRPGGYTRVLKTGHRLGDGGETAIIEFVDFNFVKAKEVPEEKEAKGKTKGKKETEEKGEKKAKTSKTKTTKSEKGEDKPKKTTKKKEVKEEPAKEKKTRKKKTDTQEA